MLDINKEGVEPKVEELPMRNMGEELRLGTHVEQVHVQLLAASDLHVLAEEEERGAQLKDDIFLVPVNRVCRPRTRRDGQAAGGLGTGDELSVGQTQYSMMILIRNSLQDCTRTGGSYPTWWQSNPHTFSDWVC